MPGTCPRGAGVARSRAGQACSVPEKYKDSYRENLLSMIDKKIQGQKVVEAPEPHIAPVIDIMEALKRTLEIRKKPVQAASEAGGLEAVAAPVEAPKKRRAGGKRNG